MGGSIEVESEFGKGSTFTFSVKFEEASSLNKSVEKNGKTKELKVEKAQVLLVEDKLINQKVSSIILNKLNYTYDLAENGKKAVDMFEEKKYDFVLMDIQMPVMDGVTATKLIHEQNKVVPPIIVLSANAMEGDKETYLKHGFDGYISKPVTYDKLKESLAKILS